MKIVVLGAQGFLGSYLCNYLAEQSYEVLPVTRKDLNLESFAEVDFWLQEHQPDVVINCAMSGVDSIGEINYTNVQRDLTIFLNFYNSVQVKRYINIGSGAEFDRRQSIANASEEDILSAHPLDSYGFTKNTIARMCLSKPNFYTLRLFGCFDKSESDNRLFKRFLADKDITVDDKYFDYISARDFAKIVDFYCDFNALPKDINCVYPQKRKLADVLQLLDPTAKINVGNKAPAYTGMGIKLVELGLELDGLEKGLGDYE